MCRWHRYHPHITIIEERKYAHKNTQNTQSLRYVKYTLFSADRIFNHNQTCHWLKSDTFDRYVPWMCITPVIWGQTTPLCQPPWHNGFILCCHNMLLEMPPIAHTNAHKYCITIVLVGGLPSFRPTRVVEGRLSSVNSMLQGHWSRAAEQDAALRCKTHFPMDIPQT